MRNSEIRKSAEFLAAETRRLADALRITAPIGEEVEQKLFQVKRSRMQKGLIESEIVFVVAGCSGEAENKALKGWCVDEVIEVSRKIIF